MEANQFAAALKRFIQRRDLLPGGEHEQEGKDQEVRRQQQERLLPELARRTSGSGNQMFQGVPADRKQASRAAGKRQRQARQATRKAKDD